MSDRDQLTDDLVSRLGSELVENLSLRDVLASGLGGIARYYMSVKTIDQLIQAVTTARELDVPFYVLGQGNQTIVSDYGFPGLIIHNGTNRVEFIPGTAKAIVESGATWAQLIFQAATHNLSGLDGLLDVPGTVGGTLRANAISATGASPRSFIRELTVIDRVGEIRRLAGARLGTSSLKQQTILIATIQFISARHDEILRRIAVAEKIRRSHQRPDVVWLGPIFGSDYAKADPTFLPHLFERARVWGMKVGGASFSRRRPNYIEGTGRLTAHDVRTLVWQVYERTAAETQDDLRLNIQFIGEWQSES